MKVSFGSVVYKAAFKYLDDFLTSIENQTYTDFTLILINDDIMNIELVEILTRHKELNLKTLIIQTDGQYKPFELRTRLLKVGKDSGFDLMILGDCDDVFSKNRIESIVKAYDSSYGFFYNEILEFNNQKVMPDMPLETLSVMEIAEKNYLGLSNSAVNLNQISEDILRQLSKGKTFYFDWFMYSIILLNGEKGKYVKTAKTYYRIHDSNLAGISIENDETIKKELMLKIDHYRLLQDMDPLFRDLLNAYSEGHYCKVDCGEEELFFWWGHLRRK